PTSVRLIDPGTGATVAFLDIPGEGSWRVEVNTGEVTFSPLEGFDQETTAIGYMVRDTQGTEGDPALLMVRMAKRPRAVEDTSLTATGSGGPAGNVLDNDFLGDGPADPDDLVLTFEDPDNTGITVDARGNVQVPTGLEPGVHTLSYTLCNMVFPELCDTASVMLTVELEALVVHNVISPNGDGTNDHLIIKGIEAYPDNVLEIF